MPGPKRYKRFMAGLDDYVYYHNLLNKKFQRTHCKWKKATGHVRRLTLQRRADLTEFIRVLAEERQGYGTLRNCLAEERELFHKRLADSNNEWLRRVENCQAFYEAEIARLKEQVEAEKMFYAYHMSDAERSREDNRALVAKNGLYYSERKAANEKAALRGWLLAGCYVLIVGLLILLVMSAQ
jgi:hypothetical protein